MSNPKDNQTDYIEEAFLANQFGDQYLYSVNRQLFDTLGAEAVYEDYLPDIIWQTNSLFVVVGSDSGLLIEHIAKHGVPSGSRYLFVELDGIEDQVARRIKPLLNESIILSNQAHWLVEAESLDYKNYLYMNQVYVIRSLGAMHAYLPAYLELYHAVTRETTAWEWFLRQQYASTKFIECQLANATENQTPVSALKDSFLGKTAVLIASGPSLDDWLPWIIENRDNLMVAAISRSARRLIEVGLKPDAIVTIDPNMVSFNVSREMLMLDTDVLLINAHQALPRLVAEWRGTRAYLGSCLPWKEEVDNPYRGITVTNAALEALMVMGFSQIILAGVDLCFRSDGSLYSSGTIESDTGAVLGHIGPKVETNDGQMAETFDSYAQAINNLTEQAALATELGCRLINPAPGAAKIPDVEHCPLSDIIIKPLTKKPSHILARYLRPDDREHRLEHYHQLDKEVERVSTRVMQVKSLVGDLLSDIDRVFGRNGAKPDLRYKEHIIQIEQRLEDHFHEELKLVKQFSMREFLRFVGRGQIGNRQLAELETDGRTYYLACRDSAEQLIQLLDATRQRIASRIAEEDPAADFMTFSTQWQKGRDNTPGRTLVWKDYHPKAYAALGAEAHALFDSELYRFNALLTTQNTWHKKYCEEKTSLENVPSKTKLLFGQQDIVGLKHLVEGLAKSHEENARPLLHFATGCLAELEDRDDDALEQYRHITEGPLLEDALQRIGHLCIHKGDASNALLAFECLAHMSISYVPTYAEVAWHAGHVKEAMELFTQYLQQVPTDLKTYLRLGKLYQKHGIIEAARMAYSHVLEQDPGNQAAESLLKSLKESAASQQHNCL